MTIDRTRNLSRPNAPLQRKPLVMNAFRHVPMVLLSLVFMPSLAHADRTDIPAQQLRQINQNISQAQGNLRVTKHRRAHAQRDLRLAEQNLATTHAKLDELTQQRSQTTQRLKTLSSQMKKLEKESMAQKTAVAAQLAALYRLGTEPELKLLLENRDPTQLSRYQHYLNAIQDARRERLEKLAKLNQQISANRDQTQQQKARLDKLIAAQRSNEKALQAQQAQRQKVLTSINQSYSSAQARVQDLNDQRAQAQDTLARIEREVAAARAAAAKRAAEARKQAAQRRQRQAEQERRARETAELAQRQQQRAEQDESNNESSPSTPPSSSGSGSSGSHQLTASEMSAQAPEDTSTDAGTADSSEQSTGGRSRPGAPWSSRWPVRGVVQTGYGQGQGIDKNGVTLSAPAGTPIHALRSGEVVFSSWLSGFGYLVIVDHGSSLSVYAHNQRNIVNVGDTVKRGTVLGTVGDTGGLTSPALYFEVRRGGRPVNPNSWVTASR